MYVSRPQSKMSFPSPFKRRYHPERCLHVILMNHSSMFSTCTGLAKCCSVVSIASFIISSFANSVSLPSCAWLLCSTQALPSGVKFSQMAFQAFSGSSGVMEGLVFLPLMTISMNLVLLFLLPSQGNQLLRYLPQTPQRWSTPSELWRVTRSMSEIMMVLEVARGKQYFLMMRSSLQMVTWLSWYRISDIFFEFDLELKYGISLGVQVVVVWGSIDRQKEYMGIIDGAILMRVLWVCLWGSSKIMHDHTTDSGISLPLLQNFLTTLAILPTAIVILFVRVGLRQFAPSILTPHSLILSKTTLKAQGQILMKNVPSMMPPSNSLASRVRIFSRYRQVVTSERKTTLPPTWHSCRILIHQQMSLSLAPSFMKQRMISGGGRSRRYRAVAPRMTRSVGNQYSSRAGAEGCSLTQTLIQWVSYYCSSQSREKRVDLSQPSSPMRQMARVQPGLVPLRIRIIIIHKIDQRSQIVT